MRCDALMIIHRSHLARGYTIIPDAALRDPRLSYEARGVLCEILSRPDDWETTADEMSAVARMQRGQRGEGRRKLRDAFAALEAAGYIQRVRVRDSRGRVATEVHVYDTPQTDDTPYGMPVPPAETRKRAGRTGIPDGWHAGRITDDHTGGTPVRPAETREGAGRTDIPPTGRHTGGTSAPPADTPVSAGRTDDHTGGTSLRSTSSTSLSARGESLHEALAAVVPDVTERETDRVREMIARRPGVRSAAAVMRAEIRDGTGPALVAQIRGHPAASTHPAVTGYRDLCGRCGTPGHDRADCAA